MSTVYIDSLNTFCQKYFIDRGVPLSPQDKLLIKHRKTNVDSEIFENLMLYDSVNFKVYGENVPLAYLTTALGVKGVERLIERQAISFTLWTPNIMMGVDNIDGLVPIMHGRINSPAHCDPEESTTIGLNFMANKLSCKQIKTLTYKIRDSYVIPKEGLESDAAAVALSAYKKNKFKLLGFDTTDLDIYNLNKDQKTKLLNCATTCLDYKFLISQNFISHTNKKLNLLFEDSFNSITKNTVRDYYSKITTIENFPDLFSLAKDLKDPLKDIAVLRDKQNIKKFRQWITESMETSDLKEITKLYVDEIQNAKGFFQTKKGKVSKSFFMWSVGAGLGSFIGPEGAVIGGALGAAVSPLTSVSLDMLDEYMINEMTKGWTPRMFFDELRSLEKNDNSYPT